MAEVVAYIMDGEDASGYRWSNSAGDWDLEEIRLAAAEYDGQYSGYALDVEVYDIYDSDYKGGECLFRRIDDAE